MFVFYKMALPDVLRIRSRIQSHIDAGSSPTEAVYQGMQEVSKVFDEAMVKHKKKFMENVEYLLVKSFITEKDRVYDPMEEFYPKPNDLPHTDCMPIGAELLNHSHKE